MTLPTPQNADIDFLTAREGYDRWSAIYDGEDNPLVALEEPVVSALLGDVAGLTVADIGCGTGRHALRLAAAGARVMAVDFSAEMLAKARAKPGAGAVTFVCHDAQQPLPLATAAFERVVCGLVLEHIADLAAFFGELRRVCGPAGFIVASAMHPAMMLRGITARFTDPTTGRETRPRSYPHQISDFVMAALQAGLAIDHMSEHAVGDALAARMERARKYLGWPMLVVMRLRPTDLGM
jgi:malonyl-CoA O-methyltransferase